MKPAHRTAALAVTAAGCAVAFSLQGTQAAFTATTSNAGNTFTAGSVRLSDNDSGTAMFQVGTLAHLDSGSKCINVTSAGTLANTVKLYATVTESDGAVPTDGALLDDHLNITVEIGTGGTFASCTGFVPTPGGQSVIYNGTLADMAAFTSFANGKALGPAGAAWSPSTSAPETRAFKFTYTLPDTAPQTVQGDGAGATFTWEAQTNT
jgi:hypothetical protein